MATRQLYKQVRGGKHRIYECPVQQGQHIAEIFPRGKTPDAQQANARDLLALFTAAPKLLAAAKLALTEMAPPNESNSKVRSALLTAIEEAEDQTV